MGRRAADTTTFVGRQAEIGAASQLLAQHRLVTMIGPGGAGKPRLAVRIATRSTDSFPDGSHLIALDSLTDPGQLAEMVAAEIGMRDVPADSFHQVATFLQDKSLLLVLDNCEHMVEACGMLIGKVLAAALTGDPDGSVALAAKAIDYSGQQGELWARGYAHYALTMAKWQQGDPDSAFRNAAECVRCCLSFNETSLFTVLAETLAGIALGSGEHARAARILGMVERTSLLVGAESTLGDSPVWLGAHHAGIAELRRRMGDKAFEAAFDAGRAIGSLSEAGPFLIEGLTSNAGPLTRREMDVAVLLADGLTNKQIGAQLSISPRTVAAHVDHMLGKLGFTSRVQIGVWITSRGTS